MRRVQRIQLAALVRADVDDRWLTIYHRVPTSKNRQTIALLSTRDAIDFATTILRVMAPHRLNDTWRDASERAPIAAGK